MRELQNEVEQLKERLFRALAEEEKARILQSSSLPSDIKDIVVANETLRHQRDIIKATAEGNLFEAVIRQCCDLVNADRASLYVLVLFKICILYLLHRFIRQQMQQIHLKH